ncbi:hypothetical protein, partial [Pseudoalteromonas sp. HM-SA03]|uniref:hypothetical protein n=1 Tax=Pseudoalteromonas sp. HM-SA03 TaxID=2029678 RepID=UPI001C3EF3F9
AAATAFRYASALRLQLLNAGFSLHKRSRGELAPTTLTHGVYVFAAKTMSEPFCRGVKPLLRHLGTLPSLGCSS